MKEIRVRFAPSPTGYLHIGGARTALFNWYFARQNKGKFVLRIEDTDTERLKEDSVSQILTSMKWLGMDWDEGPEVGGEYGPYYQSQRMELYKKEALRLVQEGKAYYCFCTAEELQAERDQQKKTGKNFRYSGKCSSISLEEAQKRLAQGEKAVIRFRLPRKGEVKVKDLIRKQVSFSLDQLDDFIIMKSNGMPAYNFACVVDDNAMAISHVIRAEEHLSNTPKQVLLYEALGYNLPEFAHLSMILAPDRSKLSKRHGATSVEEFREQGYLASALVNYLTLLGWSPGGDQELVSVEETIQNFELTKVSKNAAIYDTKKLTWMNGQYLTSENIREIVDQTLPFMVERGLITGQQATDDYGEITKIIDAVRERVKTLVEIVDASEYFFKEITSYQEKGVRKYFSKPGVDELLEKGRKALTDVEDFTVEETENAYRRLIDELEIKGGAIIHPTRLALTGRTVSPGLFDIMALLGKERCLKRLNQAIEYIK